MCGESKSAVLDNILDFFEEYELVKEDYDARDIFNLDETGLFIKNFGRRSYIIKGEDDGKSIKPDKTRITLCLSFNCYGEELTPLIIGKSKNPRAFKDIKPELYNLKYANNLSSWLTKDLFIKYLNEINESLVASERKILLLLDNFSGHRVSDLSNIKLMFFPPNTTSVLQPLDLGVISNFKMKYSQYVNDFVNAQIIDRNLDMKSAYSSLNLLDVCYWVRESIKQINPSTFYNCWGKFLAMKEKLNSGLLENTQLEREIDLEIEESIQNPEEEEDIYDDSLFDIVDVVSEHFEVERIGSNNFYMKKLESVLKSENADLIRAFIAFKNEFYKDKIKLN